MPIDSENLNSTQQALQTADHVMMIVLNGGRCSGAGANCLWVAHGATRAAEAAASGAQRHTSLVQSLVWPATLPPTVAVLWLFMGALLFTFRMRQGNQYLILDEDAEAGAAVRARRQPALVARGQPRREGGGALPVAACRPLETCISLPALPVTAGR